MEYRAYVMRVKKEKLNDYLKVHKRKNVWDDLLKSMKEAGYSEMVILQLGHEMIVFEKAEDLKKAYQLSTEDPAYQKWAKMVSELMEQHPHFEKEYIEINEVPIVFYYKDGKLLH